MYSYWCIVFFKFTPPSQWCGLYYHDLRCSQLERRWWWTLIMCYKQYSIGSCIIIFGTLWEQIYQLTFYSFLFYVLIYIYICLCIVIGMQSFHSAHIFIVCICVICTNSFNIWLWSYIYQRFIAHFPIGLEFPLITLPFQGVLMKSIGAAFFNDWMPFLTSTICVGCNIK